MKARTVYSVGEAIRYRQQRSLRQMWNDALLERIPDDMRALLEKLK